MSLLRSFVKSIPTLVLSFALAVAVWVSAVNASDPIKQDLFPRTVNIERNGLGTALVISGEVPNQASVTISAPKSVWDRMISDRAPLRAWMDLSGLDAGTHTVPIKIQSLIQPSKVVGQSPVSVMVTLEKLVTKEFQVHLVKRGEPAIGFQAETAVIDPEKVVVSGPNSLVSKVKDVRVTLDLSQANDDLKRTLDVQIVDGNGIVVEGVTVVPLQVSITQPISQRGGYRNVVVRVAYTSTAQVASGYRLTNISVFPPTVTVFASNPQLVDELPGYVETSPLDLAGIKDNLEVRLPLNLPTGVEVVGDQNVLVQVSVASIESSITLPALPIQIEGRTSDLDARISPQTVDVIITGPVPLLDRLTAGDVRVFVDLKGVAAGKYQLAPHVTLAIPELKLESILPSSIEVIVEEKPKITLPRLSATPTITPTPGSNQ